MSSSSSPADLDVRVLDVLEAIAAARDEAVTDLPPVGTALDPEALVRFVESTTVPATVVFEVHDCKVVVTGEGDVSATRLEE